MVGAKELTEEASKKIAKDSIEAIGKGSVAQTARKVLGNEAFVTMAKDEMGTSIAKNFGLAGKQLNQFTDEVFNIITHNNPGRGQDILFGLGHTIFKESPKIASIAGAMGYDALLGLTIGTARNISAITSGPVQSLP